MTGIKVCIYWESVGATRSVFEKSDPNTTTPTLGAAMQCAVTADNLNHETREDV